MNMTKFHLFWIYLITKCQIITNIDVQYYALKFNSSGVEYFIAQEMNDFEMRSCNQPCKLKTF